MSRKSETPPAHQPSQLRQWRKFRGLSQEELAAHAGVKHSTISRLENGVSAWNQDTIEILADVLDCSPSELIFMDPFNPEDFFRTIARATPVARQGLSTFLSEAASLYRDK